MWRRYGSGGEGVLYLYRPSDREVADLSAMGLLKDGAADVSERSRQRWNRKYLSGGVERLRARLIQYRPGRPSKLTRADRQELTAKSPALAKLVIRRTKERIELSNRVHVEVFTANKITGRGYTIVAVLADEVAFWRSDDGAANPDTEVLDSLRPGMGTIPGALLLGLSTPYARRGALWQAYRDHFGRDGDPVLLWQAPSVAMHPSPHLEGVVSRAMSTDPASASAEYGAEFRSDIESLISDDLLAKVVIPGRLELPPVAGIQYTAFVDPSGGQQDSMTLAISHKEGDRVVLDCVREVQAPFSPKDVVKDFAGTLRAYRVSHVMGDHYAGPWPADEFKTYGIRYEVSVQTKSEIYLSLLPLLANGRVELLDHPRLLRQLRGLDRRVARGGKDSVDHGPRGRDDVSNAAAGAIVMAVGKAREASGFGPLLVLQKKTPAMVRRETFHDPDPRGFDVTREPSQVDRDPWQRQTRGPWGQRP